MPKSKSITVTDTSRQMESAQTANKLWGVTAGENITAGNQVTFQPNYTYMDDFQTYVDTSALVAVWVESNTGTTDAAVTTTAGQFGYGTQGMRITSATGNDDETIRDEITATDMSGGQTLYIVGASSVASGDYTVELVSGANVGAAAIVFATTGTFELLSFDVDLTTFPKTGGTDVDLTIVDDIGFMVVDSSANATMDISLIAVLPATETVEVYQSDANAVASAPAIGFCPVAITSASAGEVYLYGGAEVTGQSSLIPGLRLYLSATAGGVAHFFNEAVGFTRQFVGIATSSTKFIPVLVAGEF